MSKLKLRFPRVRIYLGGGGKIFVDAICSDSW